MLLYLFLIDLVLEFGLFTGFDTAASVDGTIAKAVIPCQISMFENLRAIVGYRHKSGQNLLLGHLKHL